MPTQVLDSFGAAGVVPRRAPVTPRVRTAAGGAAMSLEYHVRGLLRAGACGIVNVFGPSGAGKTAALEHLAELFRGEPRLQLCDHHELERLPELPAGGLVILTTQQRASAALVSFEMAEWTDDDLIEYLANTHRGRVASVMRRIAASADRAQIYGLPEFWRIVLDVLAADDSIPDIGAALRWYVGLELPNETMRQAARMFSLAGVAGRGAISTPHLPLESFDSGARRLIRHRWVQLPLAAELLVNRLCSNGCADFDAALPHDLILQTATLAKSNRAAIESLLAMSRRKLRVATAASILHAMDIGWRPEPGSCPCLVGAHLNGAQWPGVQLPSCVATEARFTRANLAGARLDSASLGNCDFGGACLRGATMPGAHASSADFTGADLSCTIASLANFCHSDFAGADLRCANLSGASFSCAKFRGARLNAANLTGANLTEAQLDGADFTDANLTSTNLARQDLRETMIARARFSSAVMNHCNLEHVELPGAIFRDARLGHALLTGSIMPGADFHGAELSNTGLADIEWEGADLRRADLRGASFHAGSTRCGLVGSLTPSEGSRTGFYTDDFNDRDYKPPEEIRKAGLRDADLRCAQIDGVDFYLVDLRGARYTRGQGKWFRKCGAILRG